MKSSQTDGRARVHRPPDRGYTLLLVSLLGLWVVSPILAVVGLDEIGDVLLVTIACVAASYVMAGKGIRFAVVVALGVLLGVLIWMSLHTPLPPVAYALTSVVGAVFFGAVAFELLIDILSREGRVTTPLINGAIAVYLLIGVSFSFVFAFIYVIDPGTFRGLDPGTIGHDKFMYFSMVTLTTLGYGDVTPITRVGETVVTMEAVIGQLYLTVLVARLVGMHISQQQTKPVVPLDRGAAS